MCEVDGMVGSVSVGIDLLRVEVWYDGGAGRCRDTFLLHNESSNWFLCQAGAEYQ